MIMSSANKWCAIKSESIIVDKDLMYMEHMA